MYGLKHKQNDTRGMSLFTAVLETFAKMDRYRQATLTGAENNAKIAWTVVHDKDSTGENPFANTIKQSFGKDKGVAPETASLQDDAASKVAQMTEGQYVNLPNGAKLERHGGSTDDKFKDFFNVNIDIVYATLGIPPEVAMDKFEQNYSSSRAALKSWEYKMIVDRENILKQQYYKPFFDFWLDIAILDNMVNAEGYLQAMSDDNYMVLESYRNCRFIGAGVPHIDPAKEVRAEREKLGPMYANVPLSSAEQSMELLNTGDYSQNIKKIKDEKKQFDEIDVDPPANGNGGGGNGAS
jgi:capsid protein